MPLIMTHGWPGSVVELLDGRPADRPDRSRRHPRGRIPPGAAVHARLRLPGEPTELGCNAGRVAQAWAELMRRLGYTPLRRPGRRCGRRRHRPDGPPGAGGTPRHSHEHTRGGAGNRRPTARGIRGERAARDAFATFKEDGFGDFLEMATRPQTIGYAQLDSPVALAAWMLDHDTDSYYKFSSAFVDDEPAGNLTRDHILDNITTYWLTGTGISAARSYWEDGRAQLKRLRPASLLRRSRSRSPSPRSPAKSSRPRAAGSSRSTLASPTSTRSRKAATSPPGRSRSSSPPRCGQRSAHCADEAPILRRSIALAQ